MVFLRQCLKGCRRLNKRDIKSLYPEELKDELLNLGFPSYRANQVFEWLHNKGAAAFDEMTNVSKAQISLLDEKYEIRGCSIEKKSVSKIDGTIKYLFRLNDSELIESVLMKYKYGFSLCISTQVGCRMGCKFCASTLNGVVRSLTASEMLSQIHAAQNDESIRVSHVVLMGMGEPLDNFDNVIRFLDLAGHQLGLCLSMRNISLSTCGIVPKIYDLAEKKYQITLSVSLHAPFNEMRSEIMPINRKYPLDSLIKACRDYCRTTNRRISFEYSMISHLNDTDECANELCRLLKGMLCHVNLIPVNNVRENNFEKSDKNRIEHFKQILEKSGLNVTVRRSLGGDIDASCGQLRNNHLKRQGG